MHPGLPLECTCTHRREPFQLAFARRAVELLASDEETAFEACGSGLVVLAATESALDRPVAILRDAFGEQLDVSAPSVRYRRGVRLEEPHMGLRVLCASKLFPLVKGDLEERGGTLVDAEVNPRFGIVRATAPLARLLGYPRWLEDATHSRGQLVMWLSHYAAVPGSPGGGAAA